MLYYNNIRFIFKNYLYSKYMAWAHYLLDDFEFTTLAYIHFVRSFVTRDWLMFNMCSLFCVRLIYFFGSILS